MAAFVPSCNAVSIQGVQGAVHGFHASQVCASSSHCKSRHTTASSKRFTSAAQLNNRVQSAGRAFFAGSVAFRPEDLSFRAVERAILEVLAQAERERDFGDEPTSNQALSAAEVLEEEEAAAAAAARPRILRKNEEGFIRIATEDWECPSCQYVYEVNKGDVFRRIEPGTKWEEVPAAYKCPICNTPKTLFTNKAYEVAGFASNQGYGLGANTLTAGQKSALIYGSLAFFFILFIGGYFLQ